MENIMLNETKTNLKIVDFGLSNIWSPDSPLHTHCGSPEYAAPELFLTGQLYGPEVDMWSLGVILYGMVMGQLPFLTSRDNRISSQERRKHLLSQINKGLSSTHRKALGHFTIEFRGVLSRLLVPDPGKRMMVTDIMRHSWLTDHGKKPVKLNALCELDSFWRGLIIKEISRLIQIDVPRVEYSIRYEPYGVIGGMFNILSYRRMLQCNVPSKDDGSRRPTTVHSSATPSTVKQEITRPITSYPHGPHGKRPTVTWTADIHGTPSRLRVIGSVGANRAYNLRSAANKANVSKLETSTEIKKNSKKSEETVNRKTKSESLNRKVAASTEKEVKRRKSQPVCAGKDPPNKSGVGEVQVKARSKLTRSTLTKKKSTPKISQHVHVINERKSSLRSAVKQASTTPSEDHTCSHTLTNSASKKLIKEPIARCIAGYMSNYINLDVNKCKWIKDLTKMNNPDKTTKVVPTKVTKKTVRR